MQEMGFPGRAKIGLPFSLEAKPFDDDIVEVFLVEHRGNVVDAIITGIQRGYHDARNEPGSGQVRFQKELGEPVFVDLQVVEPQPDS